MCSSRLVWVLSLLFISCLAWDFAMPHKRSAYTAVLPDARQTRRIHRDFFYWTAHSAPGKTFVEVDRNVASAVKAMAKGRELHSVREGQAGFQSHHARIASYHALSQGHISRCAHAKDLQIFASANTAKHSLSTDKQRVSNLVAGRAKHNFVKPSWADAYDEEFPVLPLPSPLKKVPHAVTHECLPSDAAPHVVLLADLPVPPTEMREEVPCAVPANDMLLFDIPVLPSELCEEVPSAVPANDILLFDIPVLPSELRAEVPSAATANDMLLSDIPVLPTELREEAPRAAPANDMLLLDIPMLPAEPPLEVPYAAPDMLLFDTPVLSSEAHGAAYMDLEPPVPPKEESHALLSKDIAGCFMKLVPELITPILQASNTHAIEETMKLVEAAIVLMAEKILRHISTIDARVSAEIGDTCNKVGLLAEAVKTVLEKHARMESLFSVPPAAGSAGGGAPCSEWSPRSSRSRPASACSSVLDPAAKCFEPGMASLDFVPGMDSHRTWLASQGVTCEMCHCPYNEFAFPPCECGLSDSDSN